MTTSRKKLEALQLLRVEPSVSTSELARRVGIPKSSAHRLRQAAGAPSPHQWKGTPPPAPAPPPILVPPPAHAAERQGWRINERGQVVADGEG